MKSKGVTRFLQDQSRPRRGSGIATEKSATNSSTPSRLQRAQNHPTKYRDVFSAQLPRDLQPPKPEYDSSMPSPDLLVCACDILLRVNAEIKSVPFFVKAGFIAGQNKMGLAKRRKTVTHVLASNVTETCLYAPRFVAIESSPAVISPTS
jgi:hypothetical protein